MMQLFGYWRSSAAYRVRIALHLKQLDFDSVAVHLIKDGGQQYHESYGQLNPSHLVPTLVDGDLVLNQSIAIIDYLEAKYPQAALYPENLADKAIVQALALDIACEIHPLANLRVQQYLTNTLEQSEQDKLAWSHYWMNKGFVALEAKLKHTAGSFCYQNQVTIADLCLVPQVYNANRFKLDMAAFPIINRIVEHCNTLPAFKKSLPENQDDAIIA